MNKFFYISLFITVSWLAQADVPVAPEQSYTAVADSASGVVQRKFDAGFKAKYQEQSEFNYSNTSDQTNVWTRFKKWLQRKLGWISGVKVDQQPRSLFNIAVQITAVLVVIALLVYFIRAVLKKEVYWFFKRSKKQWTNDLVITEPALQESDFSLLVSQAISDDNQRLAIRYYYLWLLQILSHEQLIQWDIKKTNSDYQFEIKDPKLQREFSYLSYIYNNIWYGEFEVSSTDFAQAQAAFDHFVKQWSNE